MRFEHVWDLLDTSTCSSLLPHANSRRRFDKFAQELGNVHEHWATTSESHLIDEDSVKSVLALHNVEGPGGGATKSSVNAIDTVYA